MRKTFKRLLAVATAMTVLMGMSMSVMAASDDVVLDGGGDVNAALMKTIDPGTEGSYKYLGWAYAGDTSPEYKYLQITYHGDATALEELRLELVEPDGDPNGPGYLQKVIWFGENEAGSFKTIDGGLVPAPTAEDQTVVIDLEASGFDLQYGIRAFHIHSTPGKGTVTFTDARLMKSAGATGSEDTSTAAGDDKEDKEDTTTAASADKEDKEDTTTTALTGGDTTGGGSTSAPQTGSNPWPIAVAVGGIFVAIGAFLVSKKIEA